MNKTPPAEVTIAMPIYNGGNDLHQAMDTLLSQDYPNVRFIIADDFSTDGSYEYLQGLARTNSQIYLYRNTVNLGLNANYNNLFKNIKTEFFMFADQDDLWEETFISECMSAFSQYPNLSSSTTYTKSISMDLKRTYFIDDGLSTVGESSIKRFKKYRRKLNSGRDVGGIFCSIHKTNLFREAMPMKKVLGNDQLIISELTLKHEFYTCEKILFTKRRGGSSDSLSKVAKIYGIKENLYFRIFPMLPREIEFQKQIWSSRMTPLFSKTPLAIWSITHYFVMEHLRPGIYRSLLSLKLKMFGPDHISTTLKGKGALFTKAIFLCKVILKNIKK